MSSNDLCRLLDDEEPTVRKAVLAHLHREFERASPEELGALIWSVAATGEVALIPPVLQATVHEVPQIRQLARRALQCLHPLLGISSVSLPSPSATDYMSDWLAAREIFEPGFRKLLREYPEQGPNLVELMAECGGEVSRLSAIFADAAGLGPEFEQRAEAERRHRFPEQLIIALTYRCNRSCSYCYAIDSEKSLPQAIEMGPFIDALDWAVERSAELISFTGGEPTLHPRFPELADAVYGRGMRLYFNTNGLFGSRVLRALRPDQTASLGIHISDVHEHREGELELISRNVREMMDMGVDVFVRHTLGPQASIASVSRLLAWTQAHGIRRINLAVAFPGRSASNYHVASSRFSQQMAVFRAALDAAPEAGISIRVAKPLPLCLFTRREYARYRRMHELASTCSVRERAGSHNMVINSDGTRYTCVGLPQPTPGAPRPGVDLPALSAHHAAGIAHAQAGLLAERSDCQRCAMFDAGVCQIACLGHHNDSKSRTSSMEATA